MHLLQGCPIDVLIQIISHIDNWWRMLLSQMAYLPLVISRNLSTCKSRFVVTEWCDTIAPKPWFYWPGIKCKTINWEFENSYFFFFFLGGGMIRHILHIFVNNKKNPEITQFLPHRQIALHIAVYRYSSPVQNCIRAIRWHKRTRNEYTGYSCGLQEHL